MPVSMTRKRVASIEIPPTPRRGRTHALGAVAVGMLIVVIVILAAVPAEAQRAGSSGGWWLHSTGASVSKHALAAGEKSTRELIRLMDRNKNGIVSKEEFLRYMSAEFDRLDVNRSGQLDRREMRAALIPDWLIETSQAKPIKGRR
jgi:hypothetical protein